MRDGRTLGEVLSELARRALTERLAPQSEEEFHGFRPLPSRSRPVTNAVIDRLREEEAE